jgi:hypothetical protein
VTFVSVSDFADSAVTSTTSSTRNATDPFSRDHLNEAFAASPGSWILHAIQLVLAAAILGPQAK